MDEQFTEDPEELDEQHAREGCPRCGSTDIRRARSDGILAAFLQMLGRWPFRCRSCRSRFYRYAPPPED